MTCNIDGAAHGAPGLAACRGLFRDKSATSLGYFTNYATVKTAIYAEIFGVTRTVGIAAEKKYHSLRLECDSMLVMQVFSNHQKLKGTRFHVSDKLVYFGVTHRCTR